ncbi:uncharacterized protein [Henckelia pumila]|uniref:uncharacterized protein n=1 Tax=Henckelia pumila TaxID=405737 RepID=UPI003C6E7FEA
MRTKLPTSIWGHAILHPATLIRIRPTSYHEFSPLQLVFGQELNISHIRIFGCTVYVPISPPQRTKMGPQRRLGIYVGYDSPSIIKYLEPTTGDIFTAQFADCHFDETKFPTLGGENMRSPSELTWNASLHQFDHRTSECELEVQRIVHLQNIANKLPDEFSDVKRVTKSYLPAANSPAHIDVPKETSNDESIARLERGRPIGSKDKNPRKRKGANIMNQHIEISYSLIDNSEKFDHQIPNEVQVLDNEEISINYVKTGKRLNRAEIIIDNKFAYAMAFDVVNEDDDLDPKSVTECRNRHDWPNWKNAIQEELNSLAKREVLGPVVQTPKGVISVGCKWVFVRKRNEKNEVTRYKARLVAQGFSQRPSIDYEETYSPVIDAITFRYLLSMAAQERLEMRLMDVVTAYLYGKLDNDIYMKIPEGFKIS